MLLVLNVMEQEPDGFFQRVSSLFHKNPAYAVEKSAFGVTVREIRCCMTGSRLPWRTIKKLAGMSRFELLCREDCLPPPDTGIVRYKPPESQPLQALNAAVSVVRQSNADPQKLRIGLYDPLGQHGGMLKKTVPLAAEVRVATQKPVLYQAAAEEIMQRFGASVLVEGGLRLLEDCPIIIAPGKIEELLPAPSSALVFTGEKPAVPVQGIVLTSYAKRLPGKLAELCPYCIDKLYFSSALYERELKLLPYKIVPDYCRTNGKTVTIQSLVRHVNSLSI